MSTFLASVRIAKIKSRSQLQAAGAHSLRQDAASARRLRPGAQLGAGLAFSTRIHDGISSMDFAGMRDVVAAYEAHKARHGIAETVQGGMGFHAIVSVSPEWVAAAGGLHDRDNPRNRELLLQAVNWLETWCGQHSAYCGRVDLDEAGGGVVDVFMMPARIDGRSGRLTISTSKALTELRAKHGERMSYVAMQTDWANHCQRFLDPGIERGVPKAVTRADHLEVEEFKEASSEASRRLAAAADELEQLLATMKTLELTARERSALNFAGQRLEEHAKRRQI